MAVAIWFLFIHENKVDILQNLKIFLNLLTVVIFYDFLWLYFHFNVNIKLNKGILGRLSRNF